MPGKLRVEMVGVGHGDCFILHWEPAEGEASVVVIDGGPIGSGKKLDAALRSLGSKQVDLMVLSHTDADHVDGLLEYAQSPARLPITRYWGPCLPAFQRHRWLFPPYITRGLDVGARLEKELAQNTTISWPVENASWQSHDGGLRLRVLSPAGRIIERLLVGQDATALFLEEPMPIGWLLDPAEDAGSEDGFADLRAAIATGEIDPARVPSTLPVSLPMAAASDLAAEAKQDFGVEPEFFGNAVLNDTSLVILIEADLGGIPKRMLFTGDLQNFTYLMANHPTGLGLELVKAPHHGSRSHVGSKIEAYDEVWQWLRPRAVLVSAGGKHGLPRNDFRTAALRSGAALFCPCTRQKEVLVGPVRETSCHAEFACSKADRSVQIAFERDRVEANVQACATSGATTAPPVIQMVQHLVDPSAILDRLTTAERDRHVNWVHAKLKDAHAARLHDRETGLDAFDQTTLESLASAQRNFRAAASMDIILDAAARAGKIWVSRTDRFGRTPRQAWTLPSRQQWREMKDWLLGHAVILFAVEQRKVGLNAHELLLVADTSLLAEQISRNFAFPKAMFHQAIWPTLAETLINTKWTFAYYEDYDGGFTSLRCLPRTALESFNRISITVSTKDAESYLAYFSNHSGHKNILYIPSSLDNIIQPLWSAFRKPSSNHKYALHSSTSSYDKIFRSSGLLKKEMHQHMCNGYREGRAPEAAKQLLAAYLLGGYDDLSHGSPEANQPEA
ncbi:hypothetical protein QP175_01235 [Sphingomonas aerolata]|uniref:ComEC/Rec2 family competence protein n=1 Tax=Sphingomonas aerolata TaxID=185951 RepID=UPI002FE179A4